MVEAAKREQRDAEDKSMQDVSRANRLEEETQLLRTQLKETILAKDEYYRRSMDLENCKIELERLRHVERDNAKLRDSMKEMDGRMTTLNDKLMDVERTNQAQKTQIHENDIMMTRFADDIRHLDVQVDQKQREQDMLDRQNQELKIQLDAMKHLESKFDQIRVSLEEETQRRVNSEKECDRLRTQLNDVINQSTEDNENLKRAIDELKLQNEDNINTINVRNEENSDLNQQLLETQHRLGEREIEL